MTTANDNIETIEMQQARLKRESEAFRLEALRKATARQARSSDDTQANVSRASVR